MAIQMVSQAIFRSLPPLDRREDGFRDALGIAARLQNDMAGDDLDAPRHEGGDIGLRRVPHLHERRNSEPCIERQLGGLHREIATAEDDEPLTVEGGIFRDESGEAEGADDARRLEPAEGIDQIAGAGGDDQALETTEPGAGFIGESDDRLGQGTQMRTADESAPGIGAELDVHTRFEGFLEAGIAGENLLQHAALALHGGGPAIAVEQRHIHADQPGAERVLIHERHADPGAGDFQRGGEARFPGADHQNLGMFGSDGVFLADGVKVGNDIVVFHQTASKAWARSAIRSALFSMPTETRIVAGPIWTSAREASGTA